MCELQKSTKQVQLVSAEHFHNALTVPQQIGRFRESLSVCMIEHDCAKKPNITQPNCKQTFFIKISFLRIRFFLFYKPPLLLTLRLSLHYTFMRRG